MKYLIFTIDQAVILERPCQEVEELKHLLTTRQRLIKQKKQLEVPLKELEGKLERYVLLHMCAISARTHREEFRKHFEKKIAEGKHIMCVLNAIRNKII